MTLLDAESFDDQLILPPGLYLRDDMWKAIVNTCHIWDENGPEVAARKAEEPHGIPVFLRSRLANLGRSPAS